MMRPVSKHRRESALEAKAVKYARSLGIVVAKLTQLDGVPDRVFFVPGGKPLIVEFKAKDEEPGTLQTWYLEKLTEDGYRVFCCDTWEKFLLLMKRYKL
jgi:hypothetical protein